MASATAATTTTTAIAAPPKFKKKDREREKKEKSIPHPERLKTVVRKLPPNLPEEIFWQSVETWVTDETITWRVYYPGKFRSSPNKENIPSRAYIAFKNEAQLALFSKEYDGHLFRDKAGNESQAVVEFAPHQKVPQDKKKPDARNGTIEKDENFASFIESLAAAATPHPVSIEALIASTQPVPQPKTTPLLEALKAEKATAREKPAMKEKVAIMRNAAHDSARKEELKKKGGKSTNEPSSSVLLNKKGSGKKPASGSSGQASGGPSGKSIGPASKSKAAARQTAAAASQAPPKVLINTTSASLSTAVGTTAPEAQGEPSAPGTPRRSRPIIGLASRQFEAALSGAGVSAGERNPRREREREKESASKDKDHTVGSAGANDSSTPGPSRSAVKSRGAPARSPNRERGNSRRKNSVGARSSSATPAVLTAPPRILQRPSAPSGGAENTSAAPTMILQRTEEGSTPIPAAGPGGMPPTSPGFRSGRRGRGRGGGGNHPGAGAGGRPG